jgi:hypothetical protein
MVLVASHLHGRSEMRGLLSRLLWRWHACFAGKGCCACMCIWMEEKEWKKGRMELSASSSPSIRYENPTFICPASHVSFLYLSTPSAVIREYTYLLLRASTTTIGMSVYTRTIVLGPAALRGAGNGVQLSVPA